MNFNYKEGTLYAFLPVYASSLFQVEKPANWEKMSKDEQREYFLAKCHTNAGLCHSCSDEMECDNDIADGTGSIDIFEGED